MLTCHRELPEELAENITPRSSSIVRCCPKTFGFSNLDESQYNPLAVSYSCGGGTFSDAMNRAW